MFYRFHFTIFYFDEKFPLVDEHILFRWVADMTMFVILPPFFIPRKRLGLDDSLPSVRGSLVANWQIQRMEDLLSRLGTGQGGYRVEVEHLYHPHNFHEFTVCFCNVWVRRNKRYSTFSTYSPKMGGTLFGGVLSTFVCLGQAKFTNSPI